MHRKPDGENTARRSAQRASGQLWKLPVISITELLAAFMALKIFAKEGHCTVLLKMDNIPAISYINQKGGTHSQPLCTLALEIWEWCTQRNILLLAEHLPGRLNVFADAKSRKNINRCNWMINPSVFHLIQEAMGPFEMDLFASRLLNQIPRFYSWKPDLEAEAMDAFTQDWARTKNYANPLWCLIPQYLTQAQHQKASLTIIIPLWPYQPWFPILLEMLVDHPRQLPQMPDLIFNRTGQEFIMPQGTTPLVAWPISEILSHNKVYLQRLQNYSPPPREVRLTPATTHCLPSGLASVNNGIEIPLLDLSETLCNSAL